MSRNKSSSPVGFAGRFVVGFLLVTGAFEASRGTAFEHFIVEDVILAPTRDLINLVMPNDHVSLVDRTLVSPGATLHITRGCEGIEMFLMLVAAILAVPASWKQRLWGLATGSLLAHALSVARLTVLYYILRHAPGAWESMHGLVLPLAPVICIALFFLRWYPYGVNFVG